MEVVAIVIAFLIGIACAFLFKRQVKKGPNNQNRIVGLEYQVQSLNKELGALEAVLGSKEKEMDEIERKAQNLEDIVQREAEKNRTILSQKKSSEIRTGYIAETLAPFFLALEGHDMKKLRHMGQPIDFIAFDKEGIFFVEVKSGKSTLSYNQRQIKQQVLDGKVYWKECRIGKEVKSKVTKKGKRSDSK